MSCCLVRLLLGHREMQELDWVGLWPGLVLLVNGGEKRGGRTQLRFHPPRVPPTSQQPFGAGQALLGPSSQGGCARGAGLLRPLEGVGEELRSEQQQQQRPP